MEPQLFEQLQVEFGPAFAIMAVYSGELLGYSLTTREDFDRRMNDWAAIQQVSRAEVASQWTRIWADARSSCKSFSRGEAFERALSRCASSLHLQGNLPKSKGEPARDVQGC